MCRRRWLAQDAPAGASESTLIVRDLTSTRSTNHDSTDDSIVLPFAPPPPALQYYYGQNQSIYPAGVQYIIENVINSLEANPARTFAITEQFFFQLYYRSQTPARQAVIRQLVASGQLNFVNGGWVMHDEANPDFISMIDQQALGVRFLVDEFGPSAAPRVQWQLDPFGA